MKKNVKKANFLNKKTSRENTQPTKKKEESPQYSEDDEDIDSVGNNSYQSGDESINESESNNEIENEESESGSENENSEEFSQEEKATKKENKNIELSLEEANNIKKGKSIANQKKLFDMIIGLRISLQKIFKSSNLISYKNYAKYLSEIFKNKEERKIKIAIHSMKSYYDLLLSLMELIEALCSKGNLYSQKNLDISSMKTIINQLENEMEKFDIYKPEKFFGNKSTNESYLNFLEQSLLSTYENFQVIYENLSKLYYAVFNIWHKKTLAYDNSNKNKFGGDLSMMNFSENISKYLDLNFKKILMKYKETNNKENEEVCYNYKDDEFYNNLLKEILSQKDVNSIEDTYSATNRFDYTYNYLLNKANKTKTKIVDTKASKNRKIRYETHEKIINFMVPIENLFSHIGRDAFIKSIFGKKNLANIEDNKADDNDFDEDEENDIDII